MIKGNDTWQAVELSQFPDAKPLVGPLDILRRDIELIMHGSRPNAASTPVTHYLEF